MENPQGPLVSAPIIGETNPQSERRRNIHARLAAQYALGLKNPKLLFVREETLAEENSTSPRTIRRDITYMQTRLNMPIARFPERGGGFGFTEPVGVFPLDEFTRGEQRVLTLALHAFDAWGGIPLQKKLPRMLQKLKTTAGSKFSVDPRKLKQCITFKAGGYQAPLNEEVFETVFEALLSQQELRFPYLNLEARRAGARKPDAMEIASRHVQPLHLLCWEYAWYLFAWDYKQKDIRNFALGRMTEVTNTGKTFIPAVEFNLRAELKKSFGITRVKKAENVHLRFVPEAVPLVIERLWHQTQDMVLNADKTLDLTMKVGITPELIRWVRSWGDEVEVLAPSKLDEAILCSARRLLERRAARNLRQGDSSGMLAAGIV